MFCDENSKQCGVISQLGIARDVKSLPKGNYLGTECLLHAPASFPSTMKGNEPEWLRPGFKFTSKDTWDSPCSLVKTLPLVACPPRQLLEQGQLCVVTFALVFKWSFVCVTKVLVMFLLSGNNILNC